MNGSFCFPVKRDLKFYFFVIRFRERDGRVELNVIRESSRLTGINFCSFNCFSLCFQRFVDFEGFLRDKTSFYL